MYTRHRSLARVLNFVLHPYVALALLFILGAATYLLHPAAGLPFTALMFGRSRLVDVFNDTTSITGGNRRQYESIGKLEAIGQRLDDGRMLHIDGLLARVAFAATVGTTTGTIQGYRAHEWFKVRVAPLGFPVEYSHELNGASLRLLNLYLGRGAVRHTNAAASYASAAGAITGNLYCWLPFATEDAFEEQDSAIAALSVGRGRFSVEAVSSQLPTGVTGLSITGVNLKAAVFPKWPGVPAFRVRRDDIITTPRSFKLSQAGIIGSRLAHAFLRIDGCQDAATDNLAGTFEESVTMKHWVAGVLRSESLTIEELVVLSNFGYLNDDNVESLTAPQTVPIVGAHSNRERGSKLPYVGGGDANRIEFSADPRDAASDTRDVLMVSDQVMDVSKRSPQWNAYCEAIGVDPVEAAERAHRAPTSKAQNVDPAKEDALPWRFGPKAV